MVERIDELFRRVEDESERKRQAEFHALQAQINPHFLYNTIDTARGLVLSNRTADLNRLLRNLGEFYRNSINNGRNVVSLREEIHMLAEADSANNTPIMRVSCLTRLRAIRLG